MMVYIKLLLISFLFLKVYAGGLGKFGVALTSPISRAQTRFMGNYLGGNRASGAASLESTSSSSFFQASSGHSSTPFLRSSSSALKATTGSNLISQSTGEARAHGLTKNTNFADFSKYQQVDSNSPNPIARQLAEERLKSNPVSGKAQLTDLRFQNEESHRVVSSEILSKSLLYQHIPKPSIMAGFHGVRSQTANTLTINADKVPSEHAKIFNQVLGVNQGQRLITNTPHSPLELLQPEHVVHPQSFRIKLDTETKKQMGITKDVPKVTHQLLITNFPHSAIAEREKQPRVLVSTVHDVKKIVNGPELPDHHKIFNQVLGVKKGQRLLTGPPLGSEAPSLPLQNIPNKVYNIKLDDIAWMNNDPISPRQRQLLITNFAHSSTMAPEPVVHHGEGSFSSPVEFSEAPKPHTKAEAINKPVAPEANLQSDLEIQMNGNSRVTEPSEPADKAATRHSGEPKTPKAQETAKAQHSEIGMKNVKLRKRKAEDFESQSSKADLNFKQPRIDEETEPPIHTVQTEEERTRKGTKPIVIRRKRKFILSHNSNNVEPIPLFHDEKKREKTNNQGNIHASTFAGHQIFQTGLGQAALPKTLGDEKASFSSEDITHSIDLGSFPVPIIHEEQDVKNFRANRRRPAGPRAPNPESFSSQRLTEIKSPFMKVLPSTPNEKSLWQKMKEWIIKHYKKTKEFVKQNINKI